jgi:hypothetical protein
LLLLHRGNTTHARHMHTARHVSWQARRHMAQHAATGLLPHTAPSPPLVAMQQ